ncbi:MAG: 50S ribosomal protein L18 [Patescibacteria group bacterium]|jgi:large subunit ribosomal protein L18
MDKNKAKQQKNIRRHVRVRSKIVGAEACPRLSVFRSNTGMFLQIIDDLSGRTLASASSKEIKATGTKTDLSRELGLLIAKKAQEKKIKKVVFDRSSYRYHGRVKAAAEGARTGGLEF